MRAEVAPRLRLVAAPADPEGIVLLLHGGRENGLGPVRANQLAVLRMVPIAGRVVRIADGRLAVARLQNSVRGWNGARQSPVDDARWALAQLRERFGGGRPISLIGHSMGGRTALRVGGDPGVRSVVGLAPWLPAGEPTAHLAGREILIIHGTADHTTNPTDSHNFSDNLRHVAAQASFLAVTGGRHGLLRRRSVVEGVAAGFALSTLTRVGPPTDARRTDPSIGSETGTTAAPESESGSVANILQRALAGEASVVV